MARVKYLNLHCCYCKRQLTPSGTDRGDAATKDHVRPQSDGGYITVPCCRTCNFLKGHSDMHGWWWFVHAFPRYWKTFSNPAQVAGEIRAEWRRRVYANAGREAPDVA